MCLSMLEEECTSITPSLLTFTCSELFFQTCTNKFITPLLPPALSCEGLELDHIATRRFAHQSRANIAVLCQGPRTTSLSLQIISLKNLLEFRMTSHNSEKKTHIVVRSAMTWHRVAQLPNTSAASSLSRLPTFRGLLK